MRFVMGLDGGGTKTEAVIADETGRIWGIGRGGPMNISFVSVEQARRSVLDAIEGALREAGGAVDEVELACVGSAGPVDMLDPSAAVPVRRWHVAYEHGLCLASAVLEGPAGVILAGTGCFQYARGPRGVHRTDGLGSLMGDEGSGYWIAREALVAVGRMHDRRGPETSLLSRFMAALDAADARGVSRRLYGNGGMPRHEIAALARHVTAAAADGDVVAVQICRQAAGRLAHGLLACAREVGLLHEQFPVALTGGVISAGMVITSPLQEAVLAGAPRTRFVLPRYQPAVGGVLAALQELDTPWSPELLATLDQSLEERRRGDGV